MLESMRNSLRSPFAIAFILLIALSFVVWGTGDVFRGGTGDAVVIVGPKKITVSELSNRWRQEVNYRQRSSNGKFSEIEAKESGLDDQLLNQMITETALDAKLTELGVGVSPRMLLDYAKSYDAFADPLTGEFSEDEYLLALQRAETTPREFEKNARADLRRRQIFSLFSDNMPSPTTYTRIMMAFQQEMRQVETIFIPESAIAPPAEPTRQELEEFLAENRGYFAIPERRAGTFVVISASDIETEISPTEQELRDLYEFQKAQFAKAETRSWVQIPVADKIIAEQVAERLRAGEEADDILRDMKLPGAPLTFVDTLVTNTPDDQIAKAVFAAEDGAAGVAEGRFQWAAWKITGVTKSSEKSFEELKGELREEFIRESARDRLFEIMGNFEGSRADGMTLEEAAEAQNLIAVSMPPVDRNGRDADMNMIDLFSKNPELLEVLFDLDVLVESDIEETENGDFFALSVDEIIPTRDPELDEILDTVATAWKLRQTANAKQELAAKVKEQLETGASMADISAQYDGSRVENLILSRYQPDASIPPMLAREIFSLQPGQAQSSLMSKSQEIVVSRLQKIIPAPALSDENLMLLSSRMDQEVAKDIESQFISALRSSYTIRQDDRLKALALGDE